MNILISVPLMSRVCNETHACTDNTMLDALFDVRIPKLRVKL